MTKNLIALPHGHGLLGQQLSLQRHLSRPELPSICIYNHEKTTALLTVNLIVP